MINPTAALFEQIKAVCPIVSISIGNFADKATWRIDFDGNPTAAQRTAAQNVVSAFNPDAPDDLPALDLATLNATLVEPGSVVRALGLVMFDEINKLRVKNGDAAYTLTQFKNALTNKMR